MTTLDVGLVILRLGIGLTIAAHGYGKFFLGGRLLGTGRWFDSMGMRPGAVHARLAAVAEVGAGLAFAVGALTSWAAAGIVALMLVAGWTVHRDNGFFIVGNGWEYNFILAMAAISVAMLGAGTISVDWLVLGHNAFDGWGGFLIAGGLGVGAGVGQLLAFYRPAKRKLLYDTTLGFRDCR
jgi:putative oxidoreductase